MVLITKFFSRVKFVKPTLSELSITNTISRAPHLFSQSETEMVVLVEPKQIYNSKSNNLD